MFYFNLVSVFLCFEVVLCARFIHLGVPGSVSKGDAIWLECGYDLEGDALYSVKWYKDNVEFYRYLPSDNPSGQMYNLNGVVLDLNQSNQTHAYLNTSDFATEGEYKCEVSTEVPSFNTINANKELRVYVIPDDGPKISIASRRYRVGDLVNMTCRYGPSKPRAELKWFINNEEVTENYIKHSNQALNDTYDLEISESRLSFPLEPARLWQASLNIQCVAVISQVLDTSSLELVVGEGTMGETFQRILHVPPGQEPPVITGAQPKYLVDDVVDMNCSSARSVKKPQLKWYINDKEAKMEYLVHYPLTIYPDGLSSAKIGLKFTVLEEHLTKDDLKLKCTAVVLKQIRKHSDSIVILGDSHRSSSFHTSDNSATALSVSLLTTFQWLLLVAYFSNSICS